MDDHSTLEFAETAGPVGGSQEWKQPLFIVIVTVLVIFFALELLLHAKYTSVTIDEQVHILAGYRYWECGDYGINPEHPPLLKLVATWPIRSLHLTEAYWPCGTRMTGNSEQYSEGARFLVNNGIDRLVVSTRMAAASFSILLLLFVIMSAYEMFGPREALVAACLLILEPSLIAHGSLVTTDMAITASFFAAVYALYRYVKKPTGIRVFVLGLAVGVMLASKHSAVVGIGLLLLLLIADLVITHPKPIPPARANGAQTLRVLGACGIVGVIALLVLWCTYRFRFDPLPWPVKPETPEWRAVHSTRFPVIAAALEGTITLNERIHLLPEAYVRGLVHVAEQNGQETHIFGKIYPRGRWFYFPIALSVKSSVPLLVLLFLALFTTTLYNNRRREMLFVLFPSLGFLAASMTSGLNIGVRHILPIYPFLILVAAAAGVTWARRNSAYLAGLVILLVFGAVDAVRLFPSYIAFGNEFWGGTNKTYRVLGDSNVDWGQSLKLTKGYIDRLGIHNCWIVTDNLSIAAATLPCRRMPGPFGAIMAYDLIESAPSQIDGAVFLSASALPPELSDAYEPIFQATPQAVIGGSIFVYEGRFDVPLAASFTHTLRASQFLGRADYKEAISEGRQAIVLAPDDPKARLMLGLAYAHDQDTADAVDQLQRALRLCGLDPIRFRRTREEVEEGIRSLAIIQPDQ